MEITITVNAAVGCMEIFCILQSLIKLHYKLRFNQTMKVVFVSSSSVVAWASGAGLFPPPFEAKTEQGGVNPLVASIPLSFELYVVGNPIGCGSLIGICLMSSWVMP